MMFLENVIVIYFFGQLLAQKHIIHDITTVKIWPIHADLCSLSLLLLAVFFYVDIFWTIEIVVHILPAQR